MTTPQTAPVAVGELKRAWRAVQHGQFRSPHRLPETTTDGGGGLPTGKADAVWTPDAGERVVPVVGCVGWCGATTVALAIAEAGPERSRVVECGSGLSGLVVTSTAELGTGAAGWAMGRRGEVLLDRVGTVLAGPSLVPLPAAWVPPVEVTVLDIGWDLGLLLANTCWLADQIVEADQVVLVTTCTGPGLRRLETALELVDDVPTVGAVIGPPFRRWPADLRPFIGARTRQLDRAERLVVVPEDRRLRTVGLSTAPLPPPVLAAGTTLRQLALGQRAEGRAVS